MARYGLSLYGSSRYGEPALLEFDIGTFVVEAIGHNAVRVSWSRLPAGTDWQRLRLVRSSGGHPETPDDGITLFDEARDDTTMTAYTDAPLAGGEFYYYTLFILHNDEPVYGWVEIARGYALATANWGYLDTLWKFTPDTYRYPDDELGAGANGPLRRFLTMFAWQLDHIRSEYQSLLRLHDIDRVSADLLPVIASDLGATVEPELGDVLTRRFLRNAVYLYKRKGTLVGVEALGSSLTGWQTVARYRDTDDTVYLRLRADRINIVPNPSFEVDTYGWYVGTTLASGLLGNGMLGGGATLSRVDSWSVVGEWAATITNTSGASADIALSTYALPDGRSLYAPREGMYQGATTVHNPAAVDLSVRVDLLWYADDGTLLETAHGTVTVIAATEEARVTVAGVRPPAAHPVLRVVGIGVADGDSMQVDAVLLEPNWRLLEYFDGESDPITDHLWEKLTHGSPSHKYYRREPKARRLIDMVPGFLPPEMDSELEFNQRETEPEPDGWTKPVAHYMPHGFLPITLADGDPVLAWRDESTSAMDLNTQYGSQAFPDYRRNAVVGYPAATKDATTNGGWLRTNPTTPARSVADPGHTVFVVVDLGPDVVPTDYASVSLWFGENLKYNVNAYTAEEKLVRARAHRYSFGLSGYGSPDQETQELRVTLEQRNELGDYQQGLYWAPKFALPRQSGRHIAAFSLGPTHGVRVWWDGTLMDQVPPGPMLFPLRATDYFDFRAGTSAEYDPRWPEVVVLPTEISDTELTERLEHLRTKYQTAPAYVKSTTNPTWVGSSAASSAGAAVSSLTLNFPAGVQAGDVAYIWGYWESGAQLTMDGWSFVDDEDIGIPRVFGNVRRLRAGETTSVVINKPSWAADAAMDAFCHVFRNAGFPDGYRAKSKVVSGAGSVTVTNLIEDVELREGEIMMAFMVWTSDTAATPTTRDIPAGYTATQTKLGRHGARGSRLMDSPPGLIDAAHVVGGGVTNPVVYAKAVPIPRFG